MRRVLGFILMAWLMLYISTLDTTGRHVDLPIYTTAGERERLGEIGIGFRQTPPPLYPVRSAAEFEPVSAVLIRYPLSIPVSLVNLFSQEIEVISIVSSQNVQNQAVNVYQNNGVNMDNCSFIVASTNSTWTRDYGPWFVFTGENEIGIIDFNYNRPRPLDNAIPSIFANFYGIDYYHMGIVHTGGNYMSDGLGTAVSTQIAYTENSNLTPGEVDQIMFDYLGIENYHVVEDPTGTYIDHIDTWAKFLSSRKLMIRSVPESHSQYNQIEQSVQYFEEQISGYGVPYEIYRVFTPQNEPYTNSLILNNRVFVPLTGSEWDSAALASYESAMPGYEVYGIFHTGWHSTDALHCRTKEITDSEMLYIAHMPFLDLQPYLDTFSITAYVYPYSEEDLMPGSPSLHYRVNSGNFQSVEMSWLYQNYYEGEINNLAPGDSISYYITASDISGRTSSKPFIGEADPYMFVTSSILSYGDVDQNGFVQPLDASIVLRYYVGMDPIPEIAPRPWTGEEFLIADVDGDNQITAYDASLILQYYVGLINEFPVHSGIAGPLTYAEIFPVLSDNCLSFYGLGEVGSLSVKIQAEHAEFFNLSGPENNNMLLEISQNRDYLNIAIARAGDLLDKEQLLRLDILGPLPGDGISVKYRLNNKESQIFLVSEELETEKRYCASELTFKFYPNPFNSSTTVKFDVKKSQDVKIEIFNIKGQKIVQLTNQFFYKGRHERVWNGLCENGNPVSGGLYFCRMVSEHDILTKKILFLK